MRREEDAGAETIPSAHMVLSASPALQRIHLRRAARASELGVNRRCQRGLLQDTPTLRRDFDSNSIGSSPLLQKKVRCCLKLILLYELSEMPFQPALCFLSSDYGECISLG